MKFTTPPRKRRGSAASKNKIPSKNKTAEIQDNLLSPIMEDISPKPDSNPLVIGNEGNNQSIPPLIIPPEDDLNLSGKETETSDQEDDFSHSHSNIHSSRLDFIPQIIPAALSVSSDSPSVPFDSRERKLEFLTDDPQVRSWRSNSLYLRLLRFVLLSLPPPPFSSLFLLFSPFLSPFSFSCPLPSPLYLPFSSFLFLSPFSFSLPLSISLHPLSIITTSRLPISPCFLPAPWF